MSIKIHYIRSPRMQELPVHGAFGGINVASGQIAMSVFAERAPLPRVVEFKVEDTGETTEIGRESKDGVVRNVMATLYFDINVALSLHQWLGEKIEEFQKANPGIFEVLEPSESAAQGDN